MGLSEKDLIREIVTRVVERISDYCEKKYIPVGISNRHIHLNKEDLEILFGKGYGLTRLKDLKQPGQYAAKETVRIIGPKGTLDKVRILGPVREKTQLEISLTDSFTLGVDIPVRESGKIQGTPGIIIEGPKGRIEKENGVIAALRHIHMPTNIAKLWNIKDKEMVTVLAGDRRKLIFHNVLVRVSDKYSLEMHVDIDEANAAGLKNGDMVKIIGD